MSCWRYPYHTNNQYLSRWNFIVKIADLWRKYILYFNLNDTTFFFVWFSTQAQFMFRRASNDPHEKFVFKTTWRLDVTLTKKYCLFGNLSILFLAARASKTRSDRNWEIIGIIKFWLKRQSLDTIEKTVIVEGARCFLLFKTTMERLNNIRLTE